MGDFINEKVMPMIDKFTNSRIIKILMNGFMGVAALTIGGSLFAMLRSLPMGDWYTNFLMSTGLFDILNFPIMITGDLISLYLKLIFGLSLPWVRPGVSISRPWGVPRREPLRRPTQR